MIPEAKPEQWHVGSLEDRPLMTCRMPIRKEDYPVRHWRVILDPIEGWLESGAASTFQGFRKQAAGENLMSSMDSPVAGDYVGHLRLELIENLLNLIEHRPHPADVRT